jgi:hypothetical protein
VSFRDWYIRLIDRINLSADYARAVRILHCVDDVSGYREIRYPKMETTRHTVEAELAEAPAVEVSVHRQSRIHQTAGV